MKTHFLKIVLPAFALLLAITASLAFTSNNSMEDDAIVDVLYLPTLSVCVRISNVDIGDCQLDTVTILCIINIPNVGNRVVFEDSNVSTICNTPYYKAPVE